MNKIQNWEILARVKDGSFKIPFERKTDFEEVTTQISYYDLDAAQTYAIINLPAIILPSTTSSFDNIFPKGDDNQLCYLVSHKNRLFIVNNEGYQYARYLVELINY